jgi:hypothetical protein
MPLMFVSLAVIAVIVVSAFLGTSPRVAETRKLLLFNVATLALSTPVAAAVGWWLYADAVANQSVSRGIAVSLAIMSGGNAALFVIAIAGLVRNFLVFPRSRRLPAPPEAR